MSWYEARPPRARPPRSPENSGPTIGARSRVLNQQMSRLGRFRIAIALRLDTNFPAPKNAAVLAWPNASFDLALLPLFLVARALRCIHPAPWQCRSPMRAELRQL